MQLSVELKRDGDCLLDFKIPKAETQLVLFWCLCLTLWRVKYCQGWSSVRFVTLLPATEPVWDSEPEISPYNLATAGDKTRPAMSHWLPSSSLFVIFLWQTSKLSERFSDNFISLTVLHLFSSCKIPTKMVRIHQIILEIFPPFLFALLRPEMSRRLRAVQCEISGD